MATRFTNGLSKLEWKREEALNELAQLVALREANDACILALGEAQAYIQAKAAELQNQVKFRMEDICTTALDAVFPGKYRFEIEYIPRRGKTEVEFCVVAQNGKRYDPMLANGGGLVDVVAFSLRIAVLLISRNNPVLILDEPFKFVSASLKDAIYDIVSALSKKTGIQIVASTHDPAMIRRADRVFRVTQTEGVSHVEAS